MSDIADVVASLVISHFESLPRGQPVVRSNGVQEWTVLSGIVSIHDGIVNRKPICCATGVKAIPDEQLLRAHGRVLHDSHAEILCLRAFNLFVVKEVKALERGGGSDYLEKFCLDEGYKYALKDGVAFAMYVSEVPCGDASLELLVAEEEKEWTTWVEIDGGVMRGRDNYFDTGRVRTKPGRRDAPTSMSKSCSDKLCLKQFSGILNGVVGQIVDPTGFYIQWLVLPSSRVDEHAFERSFYERLNTREEERFHRMQLLKTSCHHKWEKSDEKAAPSKLSVISIPEHGIVEYVSNGVKDGFFSKKGLIRKNGESSVSRVKMFEECMPLFDMTSCTSYLEFKKKNERLNSNKARGYNALGAWCHTAIDDFDV